VATSKRDKTSREISTVKKDLALTVVVALFPLLEIKPTSLEWQEDSSSRLLLRWFAAAPAKTKTLYYCYQIHTLHDAKLLLSLRREELYQVEWGM
jgi:hypothetical protein